MKPAVIIFLQPIIIIIMNDWQTAAVRTEHREARGASNALRVVLVSAERARVHF